MNAAVRSLRFRAYRSDGEIETGRIDAVDEADAIRRLRLAGKTPFEVGPARTRGPAFGLFAPRLDLARFFGDVSVMLAAGFTVDVAVRVAADTLADRRHRDRALRVHDALTEGKGVAEAFAVLPETTEDVAALLASGERSGSLPGVVAALAQTYATQADRQRAVRSALLYPAILMVAMFLAVLLLSLYLAPALGPVFESAGRPPPVVVRGLLAFGDLVSGAGLPLAAAAALGAVWLAVTARTEAGQARTGRIARRLPVVSGLISRAADARYLRTMALLLGNGVPLLEAMDLGAGTSRARARRSALMTARQDVSEGAPFWQALDRTSLFPEATISLVRLGEESNSLAPMLARAGTAVDHDLQRRIDRLMVMLTPALTLVIGGLVGGLVVSVLSALLGINEIAIQ